MERLIRCSAFSASLLTVILGLTSCGTHHPGSCEEKTLDQPRFPEAVKTAAKNLGGTTDELYSETVIFKQFGDVDSSEADIFLLPTKGKQPNIWILDRQGTVYSGYPDFLRRNCLSPKD